MNDGDDLMNKPAAKSKAAVGYGHPPVAHRFKKGVSGNPKGRPRKRKEAPGIVIPGLNKLVLEEAYRQVRVREGETTIELPAIQATLRALAVSAMKGDRRSQLAFKDIVAAAEAKTVAENEFSSLTNEELRAKAAMLLLEDHSEDADADSDGDS